MTARVPETPERSEEPLTALVVGCGRVGSGYDEQRSDRPPLTHAGAYAATPQVALLGGVDLDADARRRFEQRWSARAFETLDEGLALGPDIISVATPPDGRAEVVKRLIGVAPRVIWIEKPLASTAEEGRVIVDACREAGVGLQVNFHRRFDPLHRRLVELVRGDGPPIHGDFRFSGTFENFGSHALDLFRWIAGDVVRIEAVGLRAGDPMAALRTGDGSTATLARVPLDTVAVFDVDVRTEYRRVTIAAGGEEAGEALTGPSRHFVGVQFQGLPAPLATGKAAAMTEAVRNIVGFVTQGRELLCKGEHGLAALRLYEAILCATSSREPVDVIA